MITALTINAWVPNIVDAWPDVPTPTLVKYIISITVWFATATDIILITLGIALIRLLWRI